MWVGDVVSNNEVTVKNDKTIYRGLVLKCYPLYIEVKNKFLVLGTNKTAALHQQRTYIRLYHLALASCTLECNTSPCKCL